MRYKNPHEDHARLLIGHVDNHDYVCLTPDNGMWLETFDADGANILLVAIRPVERTMPFMFPADGTYLHDFVNAPAPAQQEGLLYAGQQAALAERVVRGIGAVPIPPPAVPLVGVVPPAGFVSLLEDLERLLPLDHCQLERPLPLAAGQSLRLDLLDWPEPSEECQEEGRREPALQAVEPPPGLPRLPPQLEQQQRPQRFLAVGWLPIGPPGGSASHESQVRPCWQALSRVP